MGDDLMRKLLVALGAIVAAAINSAATTAMAANFLLPLLGGDISNGEPGSPLLTIQPGAVTAPKLASGAAAANLGYAAARAGANLDITSLGALTTALSGAQGGTGSTLGVGGTPFVDAGGGSSRSNGARWNDVVYATNFPSIGAAMTAAAGATLVFPAGAFDISGQTFSMPVAVQAGAMLNCATGQGTFNSAILADRQQIFGTGCTPTIHGAQSWVYPEWWGVYGFGVDGSAAMNAAVATGYKTLMASNASYTLCGVAMAANGGLYGGGSSTLVNLLTNCSKGYQLQGNSTYGIPNGGTGASTGDVLTCAGGTLAPGSSATQLEVTGQTGGVISSVSEASAGAYSTPPANPVSCTGGSGVGATFTLPYVASLFYVATNATGYVTLADFFVNGEVLNQSNPVDIIHFDNQGSSYLAVKDDDIENIKVVSASGTCLDLETGVRRATVKNFRAYKCGVHGIVAANGDSQYDDIDVGQSTDEGIVLSGASQVWGPTKVWYSGGSTNNYAGVLCNLCQSITMNDLWTQDNGGAGFSAVGSGANYATHLQIHQRSDSDNGVLGASIAGFASFKMQYSQIWVNAWHRSGGVGTPVSAVSLSTDTGNLVHAMIDASVQYPVTGSWAANQVTIDSRNTAFAMTDAASIQPYPYAAQDNTVTLSHTVGNVTFLAPFNGSGNSPVGLTLCIDAVQDSTGGVGITWPTNFKVSGLVVTTANTDTLLCAFYDGTYWQQTSFRSGV
jgi:hypothetical protein